ncbi:MAG: alpha-1,2-fucosyltransferase [Ferruginibacter sp.]
MFLEIKFAGGLGNQLFQYAAGRSLCIKNNIACLLLNTESYRNDSLGRSFALSNLRISGTIIQSNSIKNIFRKHTKLNSVASIFKLHKEIREKNFTLQKLENKSGFLTSLNGYWQSAHYFYEHRGILLKEFIPLQQPPLPGWIKEYNTVAVHVRRTDYLTEARYGFVGVEYYHNAMDLLKEKINNALFVIFSDDIDWCRSTFTNPGILFCEDNGWDKDYLQLHLMSRCNHQVIANSSFSWWGAWLNENPHKIVIRPVNPFKEKNLLYESHYPEEWIALNNNNN